jgi:hypothetical protein
VLAIVVPGADAVWAAAGDGAALVPAAVVFFAAVPPELVDPAGPDAGVVTPAGAVVTVVTGEALTTGSKVPSKCHFPVKLLNGPPTMVLAHSMENFFVPASYVPLGSVVAPGVEPSGFGAPWLKC